MNTQTNIKPSFISKLHLSLGTKLTLLVSASAVVLAFSAIFTSYKVHSKTENQFYIDLTRRIGNTVANQLNADQVNTLTQAVHDEEIQSVIDAEDSQPVTEWLQTQKQDSTITDLSQKLQQLEDEYKEIKDKADDENYQDALTSIKNEIVKIWLKNQKLYDICKDMQQKLLRMKEDTEVKFLYLQTQSGQYSITLVDADDDIGTFGQSSENEPAFEYVTTNMRVEADVSNGEYGWLCSGYEVVYNDSNKPIAMIGVDIDMNEIMEKRRMFLYSISGYIIILMLILAFISLFIIKKRISTPLYNLTDATASFMDNSGGTMNPPMELTLHTGDEIETLCEAIRQMEIDINDYTVNLTSMTAEKERISTELNVATKIQADMLPSIFPPFPERKDFDIFASMKPAKEVGGDFYDFFLIDDDHLAVVIGDVSGKGVPAALFMVIAKTLIKNATRHESSPKAIFEQVNNQLCENNTTGMFVTVWMGIMTISTGHIVAASAGHEYPALSTSDGPFTLMKDKHGLALGAMEGIRYREYEFDLEPNATLFVYTDGVAEATNNDNVLFGTDRMLDALNINPKASTQELLNQVHKDIDTFVQEAPQFDDITMVAVTRN